MNFENPYIEEWVLSGKARVLSNEISREFADYINSLQWDSSGLRLDWDELNWTSVDLATADTSELLDWLSKTRISMSDELVFWFSPIENPIAAEATFAILNIDVAFWKYPGQRYMFAASGEAGDYRTHFSSFIEYDGINTLRAPRK